MSTKQALLAIPLALLGTCASGCGGELTNGGAIEGAEVVIIDRTSPSFHAASADGTPQVVYVNFDGVTLSGADNDDAPSNQSNALKWGLRLSSFTFSAYAGNRQYILDKLRAAFSPYNVTFTTSRPASGPYSMVVISPSNPGGWWGTTPLDCGNENKNNISLVFKTGSQGSDDQVWRSTAHELAHGFGLGHSANAADIMQWASSGSKFTVSPYSWVTGKFYCTGTGADGDIQDEPGLLLQGLGPRGTSPQPPPESTIGGSSPIAKTANGGLVIFARSNDDTLTHNWQFSAGSGWHGWAGLGGRLASTPIVTKTPNDAFVVFALGSDGALWHNWQFSPGSGWFGWVSLGGNLASAPAIEKASTGGLVAFARGRDGALWHKWQLAAGGNWSAWVSLGGSLASTPVVAKTPNGAFVVFALGTDNALWHNWQLAPGSGWHGWVSLGGDLTSAPAIEKASTGGLVAFARGRDGTLLHKWQLAAGGNWSAWYSLGGSFASAPVLARTPNGGLVAFAQGSDGTLWHNWQLSPGSGWFGWVSLGGSLSSAPRIELASTGGLVAFARGSDGALWHTWQPQPGSLWSGWFSLGGSLKAL